MTEPEKTAMLGSQSGNKEPTAPTDPGAADKLPPVLKGRFTYRLRRRLGSGGNGAVYLADCVEGGRPGAPPREVAIKVCFATPGSAALDALKRELSSLRALDSPRITEEYDWSLEAPAFFVTRFYPDGSLQDLLEPGRPMDEALLIVLARHVLEALVVAARAGLIHLDIKPGNILRDGRGGFVVTDFGISQSSQVLSGPALTPGLGTRGYRAPEQRAARLEDFDARTDLYGLGTTLWAMATGVDLARRIDLVAQEETATYGLPPLHDHRPDLSPAMCAFVMRLLHVDRQRRPGSAAEALRLLDEVEGTATPLLPTAPPVSTESRLARAVIDGLMDPLWRAALGDESWQPPLHSYRDGELLASHGDRSYDTFVLLSGRVIVEREGTVLATIDREGTFLGEVASLTGSPRTATLRASGDVWVLTLSPADLEHFVAANPALAIRLLRTLAERVERESNRR